nr:MAG TPA: hypothetical protein [Crassvirales sp.]
MKYVIGRKDGKIIVAGGGSKEEQINLLKPNEMLYGSDIEIAPKKIFIEPSDLFLVITKKGNSNYEHAYASNPMIGGIYNYKWPETYGKNINTSPGWGINPVLIYRPIRTHEASYENVGFVIKASEATITDILSGEFEMLLYIGCPYYESSSSMPTTRASGAKYYGIAPDNKDVGSCTFKYKYGGLKVNDERLLKPYKGPYDFTVDNNGAIPLILSNDVTNNNSVSWTLGDTTLTGSRSRSYSKNRMGLYAYINGDYYWELDTEYSNDQNNLNGKPVSSSNKIYKEGGPMIDKSYITCNNCEVLFPTLMIRFE